ncbi:putative retrotransposon ty1-copia subclass protein [Tanacetum coccineum]
MRKIQKEKERKFEDNRFATTKGITRRIDYSLIRNKDQRCRILYKVEGITTFLVEYVKFWDDWEVDRYGNANLVIMEYLVNISKRRILELKRRYFEDYYSDNHSVIHSWKITRKAIRRIKRYGINILEISNMVHIQENSQCANGVTKWPTCSSDIDGFCNGGELPGMVRVGSMTYFQDHKWYDELADGILKEETLMHKAKVEESWGNATLGAMKFCAWLINSFENFHELDYNVLVKLQECWWKINAHEVAPFTRLESYGQKSYANIKTEKAHDPYLKINNIFDRNYDTSNTALEVEMCILAKPMIRSPKSPGKDIDVYLRPLIYDLQDLWALKGVETIDVAIGQMFNMRALLL